VAGCALEADLGPISVNPDPHTPGPLQPPPALIGANVSGEIIVFDSQDPEDYTVVARDAMTESLSSRLLLSSDGSHLLYNSTLTGALTLMEVATGTSVAVFEGPTNEFEFVDDNTVIYSLGGYIRNYDVGSGEDELLIPHQGFGCDHFPAISSDHSGLVFKNQPPNGAATLWQLLMLMSTAPPIQLHDNLYVNWLHPDTNEPRPHIIFKAAPGLTSSVMTWDFAAIRPLVQYPVRDEDGAIVRFSKLLVSPDLTTLVFFGGSSVYLCDLSTVDYSASELTVRHLYNNPAQHTEFAVFTPDSSYVALGSRSWISMYDARTFGRVALDPTSVIGIGGTDSSATVYDVHVVARP